MTDPMSGDPTITTDGHVVGGAGYVPDHLDPIDPSTVLVTDGPVPPVTVPEPIPWLTPELRQAIYAAMVSVGAVLGVLGLVTPDQWKPIAQGVDSVLAAALALTSLMAIMHLPKKGAQG